MVLRWSPRGRVFCKKALNLLIWDQGSSMRHSIYHIKSVLGYSGPEWLYPYGILSPPKDPSFAKNLPPKEHNTGF